MVVSKEVPLEDWIPVTSWDVREMYPAIRRAVSRRYQIRGAGGRRVRKVVNLCSA